MCDLPGSITKDISRERSIYRFFLIPNVPVWVRCINGSPKKRPCILVTNTYNQNWKILYCVQNEQLRKAGLQYTAPGAGCAVVHSQSIWKKTDFPMCR